METIGIIAAMQQESAALLRLLGKGQATSIGAYRCQRLRLLERDCWLLTCGMGPRRAAQATRALMEAVKPQLVVSVGIAGAVQADLGIGDVVVSRNTCLLDPEVRPGPLEPLAHLSASAWQAAAKALQPEAARLLWGTAVTTRGAQWIKPGREQMENPVLEMETAGIAQAAAERGLPLLSLRAISDGPQAPIPFNFERVMDDEYNLRMGEIIKAMLKHPQMFLRMLRMNRNSRKAAANAAIALIAALSQPAPIISA
jgi:adenosylhomocysteine nucleosidase